MVVYQLVLVEELLKAVFLQDEQSGRHVEAIVVLLVVVALQYHLGRVERVFLMSVHDIVHGQRQLGEDARGCLYVSARLVCRQLLHLLLVVGHLVDLQHFLGAVYTGVAYVMGNAVPAILVFLYASVAEVDIQLAHEYVGHVAQSAGVLHVEAWADVMQELVEGLEILPVLIILAHQVCAVVIVGHPVLGVRFVQGYLYHVVGVVERVGTADVVVVPAGVTILEHVKIGFIGDSFLQWAGQLIGGHLHGGQGVSVGGGVEKAYVAGVRYHLVLVVQAGDVVQLGQGVVSQRHELRHHVTFHVGIGLWVFHLSHDTFVVSGGYGT